MGRGRALLVQINPPYPLVHDNRGFESVLAVAKERPCLLSVNLQNYLENIFGCFAINHDVWRDEFGQRDHPKIISTLAD